jgi:hypothetical protein
MDGHNLSVEGMTAYAVGKLEGGLSSEQVGASIREILVKEQWPAQAIEAMMSQVESQIREKNQQTSQPDPSATMMEMLKQMMNRMEMLENQRAATSTLPSQEPISPVISPATTYIERRAKFPDPEKFNGDRTQYLTFRYQARAKLEADYKNSPGKAQVDYVFQRCTGDAARVLLPWILNQAAPTSQGLWAFMDLQFDDPHLKSKAIDQLHGIRQGRRPVREYLMEFNRLVQLTGEAFGDTNKKNLFVRGLSIELQKSTIAIPGDLPYESFVQEVIRIADILYRVNISARHQAASQSNWRRDQSPMHNNLMAGLNTHEKRRQSPDHNRPTSPERMDWQPITSNQSDVGTKRAKWVPQKEIEHRRQNRLCVRCGAGGHFIKDCPYRPPQPPSSIQVSQAVPQSPAPLLEDSPITGPNSENE